MRIELISTGDELLSGDITDTNASWLAQTLTEAGYKLSYKSTVGDDLAALVEVFKLRSGHADVIIVNGGLGPTSDDLSAQAAALALNEPLVLFEPWLATMTEMFAAMGRQMSDNNIKQAMLPRSATIVDNPVGTACGFQIQLGRALLIFTPGVPREFKTMVRDQIMPLLRQRVPQASVQIHRFLCFGVGESLLAQRLDGLVLPEFCQLGYRAAMPFLEIKIFSTGQPIPNELIAQVAQLISPHCILTQGHSLAQYVHQLLLAKSDQGEFSVGFVESCTGGLLTSALVSFAGSSRYLAFGQVCYSNQSKITLAGVDTELLQTHGAVSLAVVEQMAQTAVVKHGLQLAIAVSGIAGPEGGSEAKPVGTVAFAIARAADPATDYSTVSVESQMLLIPNRGRSAIQQMAVAIGLDMLRRALENTSPLAEYASFVRLNPSPLKLQRC